MVTPCCVVVDPPRARKKSPTNQNRQQTSQCSYAPIAGESAGLTSLDHEDTVKCSGYAFPVEKGGFENRGQSTGRNPTRFECTPRRTSPPFLPRSGRPATEQTTIELASRHLCSSPCSSPLTRFGLSRAAVAVDCCNPHVVRVERQRPREEGGKPLSPGVQLQAIASLVCPSCEL